MGTLAGKAALVTGGSRGIGAAVVRRLAADGAAVTFTYASSVTAAGELVDEVKAAGGRATAIQADQADLTRIDEVFALAAEPAAGLDIFVCKAALGQFSAVAARELGPRGITVNCVSPGATETDMFRDGNPPERNAAIVELTALGRIGEPADIADVIAFLAGPDSRWITGQNLRVTGGLVV